jgi:hypothetical protein
MRMEIRIHATIFITGNGVGEHYLRFRALQPGRSAAADLLDEHFSGVFFF